MQSALAIVFWSIAIDFYNDSKALRKYDGIPRVLAYLCGLSSGCLALSIGVLFLSQIYTLAKNVTTLESFVDGLQDVVPCINNSVPLEKTHLLLERVINNRKIKLVFADRPIPELHSLHARLIMKFHKIIVVQLRELPIRHQPSLLDFEFRGVSVPQHPSAVFLAKYPLHCILVVVRFWFGPIPN